MGYWMCLFIYIRIVYLHKSFRVGERSKTKLCLKSLHIHNDQ